MKMIIVLFLIAIFISGCGFGRGRGRHRGRISIAPVHQLQVKADIGRFNEKNINFHII